jgi:hypothetical protein
MGQAKEASLRCKIIEERQSGSSYTELSLRYGLGYNTVRIWCHRWVLDKESGLSPRFHRCGRRAAGENERSFRLVRLVAHLHVEWGIPYIVCRISRDYPDLPLQSARQYQRRIRRLRGAMPAPVLPKQEAPERARLPHEVWQIDAKERILLTDEGAGEACFLNFTDEKTSAVLHAHAFSPRTHLPNPLG